MESRLQSNEVRIPKAISSASSTPNSFVFTKSQVAILGNGGGGGTSFPTNHGSSPTLNGWSPPDFDFNTPCSYFKSSFARSLTSGSNQTKSLDFGINFGLSYTPPISEEDCTPVGYMNGAMNGGSEFDEHPPPLPQSLPPPLSSLSHDGQSLALQPTNASAAGPIAAVAGTAQNILHGPTGMPSSLNQLSQQSSLMKSGSFSSNSSSSGHSKSSSRSNRNVWSTSASHKQNSPRRSFESPEMEVLRLRKECQNLVEENRRLIGLASGIVNGSVNVPGNSTNVEAVVLQTQVDTLQWQLKQTEGSRQMYRAVMEEVVRFLDRCHRNLEAMQNAQIARSKSITHVHSDIDSMTLPSANSSPSRSGRTHSSSSLVENSQIKGSLKQQQKQDTQKSSKKHSNGSQITDKTDDRNSTSPASGASPYNYFRDFTWRRSPKRTVLYNCSLTDCDPEKLSQEAFRLLRTAENLLNTKEPLLAQSKLALDLQYNEIGSATPPPSMLHPIYSQPQQRQPISLPPNVHLHSHQPASLPYQPQQHHYQQQPPPLKPKQSTLDQEALCMSFSRKMNMRESRLSLRSSTDDSVHSNSSSKHETDEENTSPPMLKEMAPSCSTEDESGFSSISSFQEIGLPLTSSTMIAPSTGSGAYPSSMAPTSADSGECLVDSYVDVDSSSRNSTLKASRSSPLHKIGLPPPPAVHPHHYPQLQYQHKQQQQRHPHQYSHRRWDSAPAIPPRSAMLSSFTPAGDESPRVLWV